MSGVLLCITCFLQILLQLMQGVNFICCRELVLYICFFFQAEDGIRDIGVTGVQTCALPISFGTATSGRAACSSTIGRSRRRSRRGGGADPPARRMRFCLDLSHHPWSRAEDAEIGRASGRERVESSGVAVSLKKKKAAVH